MEGHRVVIVGTFRATCRAIARTGSRSPDGIARKRILSLDESAMQEAVPMTVKLHRAGSDHARSPVEGRTVVGRPAPPNAGGSLRATVRWAR
jgi:hypothetical protein